MMQQVVDENRDIRERLKRMEDSKLDPRLSASIKFSRDADSEIPTIRSTSKRNSFMSSSNSFIIRMFEFENILAKSRVYNRVKNNIDCDVSFQSSNIRSHAWSILSGLSLDQVSNLSVIALPITSDEIKRLQEVMYTPGFPASDDLVDTMLPQLFRTLMETQPPRAPDHLELSRPGLPKRRPTSNSSELSIISDSHGIVRRWEERARNRRAERL
jgi:hypothetical protein